MGVDPDPVAVDGHVDRALSFPLEVLIADLPTRDLAIGMVMQLIYPMLSVLAARWLWRKGLRAYSAVGA